MTRERRRLERFSLQVPTVIFAATNRPEAERWLSAQTRDISAAGAFVYLEPAPDVGTRLRLELAVVIASLPELLNVSEKVQLTVEGTIVRHNAHGVGVAFDEQLKFTQPVTV
ncbi:MAG: PilZ domain-containing protein [Spirochaetaceae bacterium]|nr:MAG: PilZ domain-containing protein [Spirochaetaceae bacterium]